MKVNPEKLRENAIAFFNKKDVNQSNVDRKFIDYINVYCSELKKTEWDILYNDESFDIVFSIFTSIFIVQEQSV